MLLLEQISNMGKHKLFFSSLVHNETWFRPKFRQHVWLAHLQFNGDSDFL